MKGRRPQTRTHTTTPRWSIRHAAGSLATLLLTVALATAAHGQANLDNRLDVGPTIALDSDYTPIAKPTTDWTQVGGAAFERNRVVDGSPTSFDTDLHDVTFRNRKLGLAGGTRCKEPPANPKDVLTCERVPVIYRHEADPNGESVWSKVDLPGDERRGYVGAIAWISGDRALAVGGDGVYPRRELGRGEGESYEDWVARDRTQNAGLGRAWLYAKGVWSEVDLSALREDATPEKRIRGMTALDFRTTGPDFGVAGALGQLWEWTEDGFVRRIDRDSDPAAIRNRKLFLYRVREIRFYLVPDSNPERPPHPRWTAVTAGCCSGNRAQDIPRTINLTDGQWRITRLGTDPTDGADPERTRGTVNSTGWNSRGVAVPGLLLTGENRPGAPNWCPPEGGIAVGVLGLLSGGLGPDPCVERPVAAVDASVRDGANVELNGTQCQPGYGVRGTNHVGGPPFNTLNSVETPPLTPAFCVEGASGQATTDPAAGPTRVDAGGETCHGDIGTPALEQVPAPAVPVADGACHSTPEQSADADTGVHPSPVAIDDNVAGVPIDSTVYPTREVNDAQLVPESLYAFAPNPFVGLLTSGVPTEAADGEPASAFTSNGNDAARAKLSTTRLTGIDANWSVGELRSQRSELGTLGILHDALRNRGTPADVPDSSNPSGYQFPSQARLRNYVAGNYYAAPSYTLNAVDEIDQNVWAVGDRGAILALGAAAFAKSFPDPDPPDLGTREPAKLPDASPYEAARPQKVAEAGLVPPRSAGTPEVLPSPRVQAERGLPPLSQIVMGRQGDEGWGIGGGRLAAFFDGTRWHACPANGKETEKPSPKSHPACIHAYRAEPPAGISKAYRVPLERDDDPTNDDALELMVASGGKIHRYRTGDSAWRQEPIVPGAGWKESWGVRDAAFVTPDDAWLLIQKGSSPTDGQTIARLESGEWRDCAAACDPAKRMPRAKWQGEVQGLEVAGDRIYGWGFWYTDSEPTGLGELNPTPVPFIFFRDPDSKSWNRAPVNGEYEPYHWPHRPGSPDDLPRPGPEKAVGHIGKIDALAVTHAPGRGYEGWAIGTFGGRRPVKVPDAFTAYGAVVTILAQEEVRKALGAETPFLRMRDGGDWQKVKQPRLFEDYYQRFQEQPGVGLNNAGLKAEGEIRGESVALDETGRGMLGTTGGTFGGSPRNPGGYLFSLNPARDRWEIEPSDRPIAPSTGGARPEGNINAVASDRRGGFWVSAGGRILHHTDRVQPPVFEETPMPSGQAGRPITALAGAADGTVWATTASDIVYRYDRLLGWNRLRIPGWDAGRVIIVPSPVNAVAVNPDGDGVLVGPAGRIARFDRDSIGLDAAAGVSCNLAAPIPPCGTTRNLRGVAVASDGSALAGGDRLTVLWRPPGGEFRTVEPPDPEGAGANTSVQAVAMPSPERAWLGMSSGQVFAGRMSAPGQWEWTLENPDLSMLLIRSILVRPDGSGYLIAGDGLYERDPDRADEPWRKSSWAPPWATSSDPGTPVSMAISPTGGPGMLFGAGNGRVLSLLEGRFEEVSTAASAPSGEDDAITSVALLPGTRDGEVEAWASNGTRLFHHSNEAGADRLLDPSRGASALPDAPPRRDGELALAAFGKTLCTLPAAFPCPAMLGSNEYSEVLSQRIVDTLERRRPQAALFTGDAVGNPGYAGNTVAEAAVGPGIADWAVEPFHNLPLTLVTGLATLPNGGTVAHARKKLARWGELVADRLTDRGVPLMGAIGGRDLTAAAVCPTQVCIQPTQEAKAGENLAWRTAMGARSKPWGDGAGQASGESLQFRRIADGPLTVKTKDTEVSNLRTLPTGGASTHYAVDVIAPGGRGKIARLVFLDNSVGSLAAADPIQRPLEPDGGQAAWLERMLCRAGTPAPGIGRCTRRPGQLAIVVANAPTYSYAPAKPNDIAADGATLEAALLRHGANLFVAGRIGWNGLYWTRAPGLHEPCPGGTYPEGPPGEGISVCGDGAPGEFTVEQAASSLGEALAEAGAPSALTVNLEGLDSTVGLDSALPSVVASGAGGELLDPTGAAKDGYWHGYTITRLDPSGDYRKTVVEQRPIYDWVAIEGSARWLKAGQRMNLRGFGRGPVGTGWSGLATEVVPRIDRLDGPAVTHRYSLVEADPERPWLPLKNGDGAYAPLDPSIATIDSQSGALKVGRGNQPRTYAVAMLSVGCVPESADQGTCEPDRVKGVHVATYPLVFEPRRTFKPQAAQASPRSPRVVVQSAAAAAPAVPPTQVPPQVGGLTPPPLPSLTPPPPPATGPPAASPQAPPPPPPPQPPAVPAPLALASAPPGLTIAPPGAVIPPPAPPINPAPPGGARKEARQRQAATEKSGSDSGAANQGDHEVDTASGPPGPHGQQLMTARERTKASPSFTVVARPDQPSAWSRGALYGGGLVLAALAFTGLWTARPRPRPPAVPVPARARSWRRG